MVTNFLKRCFRRFRGSQKVEKKSIQNVCPISFEEKIGFCCQHKKFSVLREKKHFALKKEKKNNIKIGKFLN